METRFLGKSGLELSAFGFGCMTFSDGEGAFGRVGATRGSDALRQVDLCIEAGVNLFDTADIYSSGRSEEILGELLGERRKNLVIASKAFGPMGPGRHDLGLSRRHLIEACDASLRRLRTDWIDLYQVHNFDTRTPLEETMRALDDLVTAGKVRYVGCSNFAGWQLMKAAAIAREEQLSPFIGQQIQYSLMVRDAEHELLPCGLDQGVGALIWSPLAQGFLSGKFRTGQTEPTRLESTGGTATYDNERGRAVLAAMDAIVAERDNAVTLTQVALNWVRRRPGVTSVLIGARNEAQLLDNLAAAEWSLTDEEMQRLDTASQQPLPYPQSHQYGMSRGRNQVIFPRYG